MWSVGDGGLGGERSCQRQRHNRGVDFSQDGQQPFRVDASMRVLVRPASSSTGTKDRVSLHRCHRDKAKSV